MSLYLDVEWNCHHNELISIALASTCGKHFYEVAPEPRVWAEWAYANLYPVLGKEPIAFNELRFRLRTYLQARPGVRIYADYPGDFWHLMQLMCGRGYEDHWISPCEMVLLDQSEPKPEVPHNALSDAKALMEWHLQSEGAMA